MSEIARGDRVFLATDPIREQGTVESVIDGTVAVWWERTRRRWLYAAEQLRRVTP